MDPVACAYDRWREINGMDPLPGARCRAMNPDHHKYAPPAIYRQPIEAPSGYDGSDPWWDETRTIH